MPLRAVLIASLLLAALTARAAAADDDSDSASDSHSASAGVDASLTRWGTSYETIWLASFEVVGSVALGQGGVRVSGRMPLTSSFIEKSACCRVGIGNATLGVSAPLYRRGRLSVGGGLAVSAPTAGSLEDDADLNTRYAAMAAVTRDAGLYQPETTTLRADLAGQLRLGPRSWLTAGVAAHVWLPDGDVVVPLTVAAGWQITPRLGSDLAFTTLAKPDEDEAFLHAIELGLAWRGRHDAIRARLHVPLDDSLRDVDMLGAGVSYARSF